MFSHPIGFGENNGKPGHDVTEDSLQRQPDAQSCDTDACEQRRDLNSQLA